jgi:hypothetical protein
VNEMGILAKIFSPIAKLLSLIFKKREKKAPEKKTVHERIHEGFYKKAYSNLLKLKDRLGSVRNEEGVKEAKRELESIRLEFKHMNPKQRRFLAGLFGHCDSKIKGLEKKFKNLKRREQRLAKKAA